MTDRIIKIAPTTILDTEVAAWPVYERYQESWQGIPLQPGASLRQGFISHSEDHFDFLLAALGRSYVDRTIPLSPVLKRLLPYQHAQVGLSLYCGSAEFVKAGKHSMIDRVYPASPPPPPPPPFPPTDINPTSIYNDATVPGYWVGDCYEYQMTFGRPLFRAALTDAEAALRLDGELCRYVHRQSVPRPRELKRPDFGFETDEANPVPITQVGFFASIEIDFDYTFFQVPYDGVPFANIVAGFTKVNDAVFDPIEQPGWFAPEVMLLKGCSGWDQVYRIIDDQQYYVDLTYHFSLQPLTWNKFKKADGTVVSVRVKDQPGVRPYSTYDMTKLFKVI